LENIKKRLIESENQQMEYAGIINENKEMLKEKLNNRSNDQQTRIESIKEIASYERKNLYNNIINLINDQDRFSLDSLLEYSNY